MPKVKTIVPATHVTETRVRELGHYLVLMSRIQDKVDADFLISLGNLNMQQLNVLNIIGDTTQCTMGEIAAQSMMSLSSVTVIVDKLVKMKLVKRIRSLEDRRVVRGALTESGNKLYKLQIEYLHDMTRKMLQVLTVTEQENFISLVGKIMKAFG
jgi:DNA-binding MarR family transcriptional regulator